eukprot:TRINITY_DN763_c0_g1_i1.p1 TRINITY_DN763_c0_g1~~TRINITY_DN763_c0_g1_i1.p1  ORF type:complete len:208 (-),score=40.22 TRINITY_DN763_c0_g1_i1:380-1003(-)
MYFPTNPHSRDISGRSSAWNLGDRFYPSKMGTKLCMALFFCYVEFAQQDIIECRNGLCFSLNLRGFGWANFHKETQSKIATTMSNAYPIRLKRISPVNPPWVFKTVFKLIKPLLSKKLQSRVVFLNEGELIEYYDEDQIPESFGGIALVDRDTFEAGMEDTYHRIKQTMREYREKYEETYGTSSYNVSKSKKKTKKRKKKKMKESKE